MGSYHVRRSDILPEGQRARSAPRVRPHRRGLVTAVGLGTVAASLAATMTTGAVLSAHTSKSSAKTSSTASTSGSLLGGFWHRHPTSSPTPAPVSSSKAPAVVPPSTSPAPTSSAPTSVAPTSAAPTSVAPTSAAPTSVAPTSVAPTSVAPTGLAKWHYTANGVFSGSTYSPGADGFNLVDVESTWWANHLPAGTKALVWLGLCNGADSTFTSTVTPYLNNPGVLGYYLFDEPDPTGQWKAQCTAANLKAESDWIHTHDPGKLTFLMLMNMSSNSHPTYEGTYNPANTGIDLYGLDPYPCRSELNGCDYTYITKRVAAAEAWGIPQSALVPVFQTFGGGGWVDDGGGSYALPTADQEKQLLATWDSVLPAPVFDYAYSWGTQNGDTSLNTSPDLQTVITAHNTRAS